MSGDLILGIDGGGTKTIAALADRSGTIIRCGFGGGVNPMDNPDWRSELQRALAPFIGDGTIVSVAAALPVFGEVLHMSREQEKLIGQAFPSARTTVLNDVDAAQRGAFAGKAGILILSGTGSMVWARDAKGQSARSGGWGDVIGDEGSSYWIGRLALNLVSQSLDGRAPPSKLTGMLFDYLGLDLSDAMNALGDWVSVVPQPRSAIAGLAILVDRAAREGDNGAIGLLERAADELAKHHRAIAKQCDAGVGWTYAGGTFSSAVLLEALEKRIGTAALAPELPPIGGALLAAAQELDWPQENGWIEHTAASARTALTQSIHAKPQ